METSQKNGNSITQQSGAMAANVLSGPGAGPNDKTAFMLKKEVMITRHVEELAASNKSLMSRMLLNRDDKNLLKEYAEKQQEAVSIILSNQNKSLSAISNGQVTMVKEVVNTLLKSGRSGLKELSDVNLTEVRVRRTRKMEKLSIEFYDMIEEKMADAERRKEPLQSIKLREVDHDLKKWEEDYITLLEEFSNIIKEQVGSPFTLRQLSVTPWSAPVRSFRLHYQTSLAVGCKSPRSLYNLSLRLPVKCRIISRPIFRCLPALVLAK